MATGLRKHDAEKSTATRLPGVGEQPAVLLYRADGEAQPRVFGPRPLLPRVGQEVDLFDVTEADLGVLAKVLVQRCRARAWHAHEHEARQIEAAPANACPPPPVRWGSTLLHYAKNDNARGRRSSQLQVGCTRPTVVMMSDGCAEKDPEHRYVPAA